MIRRLLASVALSLAAWTTPISAAVLIDTGKPTGTPWAFTFEEIYAAQFSVTTATDITDIQAYIAGKNSTNVSVYLFADASDLPGQTLYETKFLYIPNDLFCQFGGPCTPDFTGPSGLDWTVDAGTYWVGFLGGVPNIMPGGAPNPLGKEAYQLLDGSGADFTRYDSYDFGFRIFGDPANPTVPEPSTWAMMAVGLGLIGISMRGRARSERILVPSA